MKHVWTGPQPEKAWRPRVYSNPPFGSGGVAVDHKRLRMKTFSGGVWMMSSAAAEGGVSMWNILKEFPVVSVWTQTTNGAGTPPSVRSDTGLCSDVAAVLRDYWICEENLDLENRDPQTLDPPENLWQTSTQTLESTTRTCTHVDGILNEDHGLLEVQVLICGDTAERQTEQNRKWPQRLVSITSKRPLADFQAGQTFKWIDVSKIFSQQDAIISASTKRHQVNFNLGLWR